MTPQTSPNVAPRPFLGTKAKSIHARTKAKDAKGDYGLRAKTLRYDLQRAAQRLMYNRTAAKQARVCGCCRNVKSDRVQIYRTTDKTAARFANLVTCGSVWACPVCSAKVTEKRRAELQDAMNSWRKQGGSVYMQTLTFPHEADMPLEELKKKFAKALQVFKNSRDYKRISKSHGRIGSVRSLEITHGVNGWHPHTHELIFARAGMLDDRQAMNDLRMAWIAAVFKAGLGEKGKLDAMLEHAFDFQGGDKAADYALKFGREIDEWNVCREMTKSHAKIGARNVGGNIHATPFQLLLWYLNGDEESGAKFVEYAKSFEGARMLFWSPKLRATLALADEQSDDDLAIQEEKMPDEEHIYEMTPEQWKLVLSRNSRGQLLHWAALYGAEGVDHFLADLNASPVTHSGIFQDWQEKRFH